MNDQSEIKKLLDQIQDLVAITKNEKLKQEKVPEDVMERLAALEGKIKLMVAMNDVVLADLNISDAQIEQARSEIENLPPKEKNVLERTDLLQHEVKELEQTYETTLKKQKKQVEVATGKGAQKRKKKFRGLGSQPNWTPL